MNENLETERKLYYLEPVGDIQNEDKHRILPEIVDLEDEQEE